MKLLNFFEEIAYNLLRISSGFLFMQHGIQKTFGSLGGNIVEYTSIFGIAGFIELIGGILMILGLFTSFSAFICSGMMAIAYFGWHAYKSFWPILNKGELAALYAFVFLYIATRGDGKYS